MDKLDGIWRLVDNRALNEKTDRLSVPYGAHPLGTIVFEKGRMLAALCNGDRELAAGAASEFRAYGGRYTFDGELLTCDVDMSSEPTRLGSKQVRAVLVIGDDEILVRPPAALYGDKQEQRELIWVRVWRPDADRAAALPGA